VKGSKQEPHSYLYMYKVISHYVFIMDACPDHILESTKRIEVKLGSWIDGSLRIGHNNHNPDLYFVLSYLPLIILFS